MEFYLGELSVNGCKNINQTLKFKFCNTTLKKDNNFKGTNVKAIYGPNGSGKSAIMTALYIYRRIIMDEDGLSDKYFSSLIHEVINKETNTMEIEITFLAYVLENHLPFVIRHYIQLRAEGNYVYISKEKISELKGNSIRDDKFRELISVDKGNITYLFGVDDLNNNLIYKSTLNLLNKHSVIVSYENVYNYENKDNNSILNIESQCAIIMIKFFSFGLVVELVDEDRHRDYISRKIFIDNFTKLDSSAQSNNLKRVLEKATTEKYIFDVSVEAMDEVEKDEIESYEENIKQLSEFIKIFKPDFVGIEIDKKINQDTYYCKKIFVYKNYKIDIEFESTGIKRLVKMFSSLKASANGGIVFIDEMDANLHDVYFTKLIEFFKEQSRGQLCFTTHNLEPIEVLKDCSHSLDFVSNDSRLSSWVKSGNKSPMKKYVNGLIPYSTFNVGSIDFEVLLDED